MRNFLITSTKYSGTAEMLYSDAGLLIKIDLTNAYMDATVVKHFKAAMPCTIAALERGEGIGPDTTVVEGSYQVTFEMFWDAYKKKLKLSACKQLWSRLSKTEQIKAFMGVATYDKFLLRESWRSKADPATYLRNKYWENDYK